MLFKKLRRLVRGKPISAATLNEFISTAEKVTRWEVGAPLATSSVGKTKLIYQSKKEPFDARLIGTTSPYTFVEAYTTAGGAYVDLPGGRTGQVYEYNNKSGLGGRHLEIKHTYANDYRFQWVAKGTPCNGTICVTTTICGTPEDGVTVTATDTAIPPNTIGPCSTSSKVVTLTLNAAGSGYTNGTGYAATFSGGGGGSGATATFDVVGGHVTNLVLTAGGSGWTSNPTVGFGAAGAGHGARATATVKRSTCCLSITDADTYTITATGPCGSATTTLPVACSEHAATTINVPGSTVTFAVTYECGLQATANFGATTGFPLTRIIVTDGGGHVVANVFNDPNGKSICLQPNQTYTFTWVDDPCWVTPAPQTVNVGCSKTITFSIAAVTTTFDLGVSGCGPTGCPGLPLPGATVTWTGSAGSGSGTTNGAGVVTITAKATCHYTYIVSKARFNTFTGSFTASCSSGGAEYVGLVPASGYICCGVCADPIPTTLNVSGPNGTFAINYVPATGKWAGGCHLVPAEVSCLKPSIPGTFACEFTFDTSGTVYYSYFDNAAVGFVFDCFSIGGGCGPPGLYRLDVIDTSCFVPTSSGIGTVVTVTKGTCDPTYDMPKTGNGPQPPCLRLGNEVVLTGGSLYLGTTSQCVGVPLNVSITVTGSPVESGTFTITE